jgi:hypothetical protein
VNEKGKLEIDTPSGGFEDGRPVAYQIVDGRRKEVGVKYDLKNEEENPFSYGFHIPAYDATQTLILDPALIVYCGYIGGPKGDGATDIAVDADGNVYISGGTLSDESGFPVCTGPDLTFNDRYSYPMGDAFVAKINSEGTHLIYCGYIGGAVTDAAYNIDVDPQGNAYVLGWTSSGQDSFPVKVGPDLTINGQEDLFVAKVNAQGTDLVYCGYLGGDSSEYEGGIAVDLEGNAYVTGSTFSDETSFPVKVGPDLTFNKGTGPGYSMDAFIARVNADGTHLDYCGYIGGIEGDYGNDVALDSKGCAYVAGTTGSDEMSFPIKTGPDLTFNGKYFDCFVAKVTASGDDLVYCGYIGGDKNESDNYYNAVAVDSEGSAYVTGATYSDESSFPVKIGPDLTHNGKKDVFVARVNAGGTDLDYCGYIGGDDDETTMCLAIDTHGNAYLLGSTESTEATFPVKLGPDYTYNGGNDDLFVARVKASGAGLDYCGYLGGDDDDTLGGITVDAEGNAYMAGGTHSKETSFPVKKGPDLTHNGLHDAFIAKLAYTPPLTADGDFLSAGSGGSILFSLDADTNSAGRTYLVLGSITGTEPGYPLPGGDEMLPLNWDLFTEIVLSMLNTQVFDKFMDALDDSGKGRARLNAPPLPPAAVGINMFFAFCLNSPFNFASNPVKIEIIP